MFRSLHLLVVTIIGMMVLQETNAYYGGGRSNNHRLQTEYWRLGAYRNFVATPPPVPWWPSGGRSNNRFLQTEYWRVGVLRNNAKPPPPPRWPRRYHTRTNRLWTIGTLPA